MSKTNTAGAAGPGQQTRYQRPVFPFAALVGQPRLKAALLANAVDPSIGGLLIRGEKGTGKTTIVRGLAELLPPLQVVQDCPYHCDPADPDTPHAECRDKIRATGLETATIPVPLVELPLNATEERVAGTVHLEETLRTGQRRFEPGLLAAANRGILYIDEVNLLEDHLVDLVLDAAATGVHRVEREGFSLEHPSDFLLVGTMNPEEGELRPQFIDRFGLCISVKGESEPALRKAIARRRISFEAGPRRFAEQWRAEQQRLSATVAAARELLPQVELPEELWDTIVSYAAQGGVQGHRADIVMAKCAVALAALNSRRRVAPQDVQEAARLALPHRIGGRVDDTPESAADRLEQLLAGVQLPDLEAPPQPDARKSQAPPHDQPAEKPSAFEGRAERTVDPLEELQVPGSAAAGSIVFDFLKKKSPR
ncbi:MAG: ATP-binding protein [Spirochaetota bacterium]